MVPDLSLRRRMATQRFIASVVLLLGSAPLQAQRGPDAGQPAPGGSGRYLGRLQEIARRLAEQHGSRVVVDPCIEPAIPPRAPDEALPIDQALGAVTRSLRGVAWRRVYPSQQQSQRPLPPEELAAAARMLDQLASGSLVLEETRSQRATVYVSDQPVSPAFASELAKRKLSSAPIYVVYSTVAADDGGKPERRLADLQRQQLEINVPEEQQALAMAQTMQLLQSLDPAKAEQLMSRTLEAGMRVWETTSPDQRTEMIHQSFRLMQRFGGGPAGGPAPGRAGGARGPGDRPPDRASGAPRPQGVPLQTVPDNHVGELKALAATLAARYERTLLIDPELFLAVPPQSLPADLSIEEALQTVTAPLSGIAWRRLYLTDAQLKTLKRSSATEKLAAAVRALEQLESGDLVLEDAATRRAITYLKNQPLSPALDAARAEWKLNETPVYLLYSTTPSARGGTLVERFAHLQRQQMEQMLRMSPDQMAQSMEQVILAYPTADPVLQMRMMGLPVMAGMMATWFPRAAKEARDPATP